MTSPPSLQDLVKDVSKEKLESQCKEGLLKRLALSTTEWRSSAPFFGFDESEIEEIIHEHPHSIQQQTNKFYIRWRVKARNATYRRLTEIFHDVKRNDLVTKVVELLQSHNHDDNDTYTLEDLVKGVSKERLDSTCREGDLKILALATTKWKTISPFLGFKKFEEEKIVSDYQDNITRQKIELYLQWREKDVKNATNRKLIEKLYIIKRIDLVKELVKLLTQSNNYDIFEDDDGYTIYLRKLYQTGVPPQALRWPPVERCKYVTLSLIQEEEVHERNYEDEFDRLMIQHSPGKKNSLQVTLDDIFKLDQSHRKVILVEGTSGVGKTTLALHICHRWAEGLLFESYKYVILIQLQNPMVQTAKTLADILPHPSTKEPTKLCQFPVDGEGTLFIIDGWDEFKLKDENESFIHKLLLDPESLGVPLSTVLITSQPNASAKLQQIATSRVRIVGFTPEKIEEYFMETLKNKDKVKRLFSHLKQYPSLKNICCIPLNAAIISHFFLSHNKLPSTLHITLCSLVLNCIIHDVLRQTPKRELKVSDLSKLPPDLCRQVNQIAFLAYKGPLQVKATFTEEELKELGLPTALPTLGLMQEVEYFDCYGTAKYYSFMHIPVQQLLSAFYISQWRPSLQAEVFQQSFFLNTFSMPLFSRFDVQGYVHSIFQHYSGFTQLKGSEVEQSVLQVVEEYKKVRYGFISLKYNESCWRTRPLLSLVVCLYEAKNKHLCKLVASHLEGRINFAFVSLSVYELLSLGFLLQFFPTEETVRLNFDHSWMHDEEIEHLFKECTGKTCSLQLDFQSNELSVKCAKVLASLLLKNKLVNVDLSWNSVSDEGAKHIANALKFNKSLVILELNHCHIGDEGLHEISKSLSDNHTLQELGLSGNSFTDNGLMLLSSGLGENRGITKLSVDPGIDVCLLPSLSKVTGQVLQLFLTGVAKNPTITHLDIGEFKDHKGVKESIKLINEGRTMNGHHMLTLIFREETLRTAIVPPTEESLSAPEVPAQPPMFPQAPPFSPTIPFHPQLVLTNSAQISSILSPQTSQGSE